MQDSLLITSLLDDELIAREVQGMVGERASVRVTPRFVVVTCRGPADLAEVEKTCPPFNRRGVFESDGSTCEHRRLVFRRVA